MAINKKFLSVSVAFVAAASFLSIFALPAFADHSADDIAPSQATATHHDDEDHNDDHGLNAAIQSTDVAQLKAYIALLTQLIELLNKKAQLEKGSSSDQVHKDDADHDDDHDEDSETHDEDSDDHHDED